VLRRAERSPKELGRVENSGKHLRKGEVRRLEKR
jgi:hypothetical protein